MTKTVTRVGKLVAVIPIVYLLFVLITFQAQAQEPITASWETDAPPEAGWTVGDPIPLRLRVTYPADFDVTLPELPAQWGPFEVREQTLLDTVQNDSGAVTAVREVKVTLWAPGEYETPPLTIHYRYAGGAGGTEDVRKSGQIPAEGGQGPDQPV
jgi:hypothetical protein